MSFYAVAKGRARGIFSSWAECKALVDGYGGAIYKKFTTHEEAATFISNNSVLEITGSKKIEGTVTPSLKNAFSMLMKPKEIVEPDYYVYTDGACSNNGKATAEAGIGIYFGHNDDRNISQRIEGKQTNNTAELGAILYLYKLIEKDIAVGKKIGIVSDSKYAIGCATTYGKKCELDGWVSDIPNKAVVKQVYELYKGKGSITFIHVKAHTGAQDVHSVGNAGADMLANRAVGM